MISRSGDGGSVVLFKRPNSSYIDWAFPLETEIERAATIDQLNIEEGFLFFPFDRRSTHPLFSIHSSFQKADISLFTSIQGQNGSFTEDPINSTSEQDHIHAISKALVDIKNNTVEKVVLARRRSLNGHVEPVSAFIKAALKYPEAFVFLVRLPDVGTWLGASPERLLQIVNGSAQIDSLAGTQRSRSGERRRKWEDKEFEEQRIVTVYIDEILNEIELPHNWSTVQDKLAGDLIHLHASAQFSIRWGSNKAWDLVDRLHPTPAVCGTPKENALKLIERLENFDREYYTGILGPVSQNGSTDLFVNLRCMNIFDDRVEIYAGGGITEDSDPKAEWLETEYKCRTMMDLLS